MSTLKQSNKLNFVTFTLTGLFALILTGCTTAVEVPVSSNPSGVPILVDDQQYGITPVNVRLIYTEEDYHRNREYTVVAKQEGYFPAMATIGPNSTSVHFELDKKSKLVTISSSPIGTKVEVDGVNVGESPVQHEFDFDNLSKTYKVIVSKRGYCNGQMLVNYNSLPLNEGNIRFELEEDPVWIATDWSDATNKWLRVPIDPSISYDDAWQKVVDSVTSVYDSLDQLDQTSGYFRSTPYIREFEACSTGAYYIRTQMIGTVASKSPLVYKFKLISNVRLKEQSEEFAWKDYDRVFRSDTQLIEELLNRLGLK